MIALLREKLFWLMDTFRGFPVRRHLSDIRRINENGDYELVATNKQKYLEHILTHAIRSVPYYQKLNLNTTDLNTFPIVDKNSIRENLPDFLSQAYRNKKLYKVSTSGSTGTPFTAYQDKNKQLRNTADTLYFAGKAGYKVGKPLFFMRIWENQGIGGLLRKIIQNVHQINVTQLDDLEIEKILNKLSRGPANKSILAYASAYDAICSYVERNRPGFSNRKVQSIISMSEALEEHTKTALQQYFHCPVVSRYSNRENGILAQQLPGFGNNFLPNEASYRFEVLDLRSDQPVNEGEIGRIVVTDYFNFAMPLIRYDTGDIGVLAKFRTAGKEHIVFSKIEGRRMDAVYDTSGELVSSFIFPNRLRTYREIRQFQFIQTGADSYMFKLCATPDFNSEKKLIDEFRGFLGDNAEISVTYVDEIPLLASGKRKKVVNTFRAVKKK